VATNREAADALHRPVDVLVVGGTHAALIEHVDGTLVVNPGSPSPAERLTVSVLDLGGDAPVATIVEI
jgi:predicted phosphodiesterase